MKQNIFKKLIVTSFMIALAAVTLTGCGQSSPTSEVTPTARVTSPSSGTSEVAKELSVRFGDSGEPFTMHLYDNDTATAIARHVGTAAWRIPIYNYQGYDNWEVMQYYDIPSRYEIPSNPERVTTQKIGTVYYSEPNRIVLFYGDAEVPGDYTPVGYFEATQEFVSAVENNPVPDGWSNKIINISAD